MLNSLSILTIGLENPMDSIILDIDLLKFLVIHHQVRNLLKVLNILHMKM
jgi:hypothetical protein